MCIRDRITCTYKFSFSQLSFPKYGTESMSEYVLAWYNTIKNILVLLFMNHYSLKHFSVFHKFDLSAPTHSLFCSFPVIICSAVKCLNLKVILRIPVETVDCQGIFIVDHVAVVKFIRFNTITNNITISSFNRFPGKGCIATIFRVADNHNIFNLSEFSLIRVSENP